MMSTGRSTPFSGRRGCSRVESLRHRLRQLIALALMSAPWSGVACSRSSRPDVPRFPVRGKVFVDNAPLSDGRVSFVTVAAGLSDVMEIKDGAFSGEAAAGERRVEFSRVINVKPSGPPIAGMPAEVPQESLPAKLNSESTYTVTVQTSGENNFTFDLKSR